MTSHVLWIIATLLMSGELSYGADPDYIRLDLSPLRGRDVPSNTTAYPRRIPAEHSAEKTAIFCTDSAYPNDIFCDVRTYYENLPMSHSSYIEDIVIEYPHLERSDIACNVIFKTEQAEEYPLPRLPYFGFFCNPSLNDTELPVFQLTEAYILTITQIEIHSKCVFIFKNEGRETKSLPKGRRVTVIKFEQDRVTCVKPLAIGRPPPEMECEYDGRRCRPVNQ